MTKNTLFITSFLLLFSGVVLTLNSCKEVPETIYEEEFNTKDIQPDPEADKAFVNARNEYLTNTVSVYKLDSKIIETEGVFASKSTVLDDQITFDFSYTAHDTIYFVSNKLNMMKDADETDFAWESSTDYFWKGYFSKKTKKEDFTIFRSQTVNRLGDASEYSELDIGTTRMIMWHIRSGNTILSYSQIIDASKKEDYIKLIRSNFKKLTRL